MDFTSILSGAMSKGLNVGIRLQSGHSFRCFVQEMGADCACFKLSAEDDRLMYVPLALIELVEIKEKPAGV